MLKTHPTDMTISGHYAIQVTQTTFFVGNFQITFEFSQIRTLKWNSLQLPLSKYRRSYTRLFVVTFIEQIFNKV